MFIGKVLSFIGFIKVYYGLGRIDFLFRRNLIYMIFKGREF